MGLGRSNQSILDDRQQNITHTWQDNQLTINDSPSGGVETSIPGNSDRPSSADINSSLTRRLIRVS